MNIDREEALASARRLYQYLSYVIQGTEGAQRGELFSMLGDATQIITYLEHPEGQAGDVFAPYGRPHEGRRA